MTSFLAVLANIETGEAVTTVVIEADSVEDGFIKAEEEAAAQNLYVSDLFARD